MPTSYQEPIVIVKKRYNRLSVNNQAIFIIITKSASHLIPLTFKELVLEIHPKTIYDPLTIVLKTPTLTDRKLVTVTMQTGCSYTRSISKTFSNEITDQVQEGHYELMKIDDDLWHAILISD